MMGGNNVTKKHVKVLKDGPYLVSADIPLYAEVMEPDENGNSVGVSRTKTYDTEGKEYALCRCGRSANKPFCDGSHEHADWDSEERASREFYADAAKVYEGGTIDLLDRPEICMVARYCDVVNTWKAVLKSSDDDPEQERIAIQEACDCPSGRLTVRKDGVEVEPELPQEIAALSDRHYKHKGPLYVKGGITIVGEDNTEFEVRNRRTLCRCGESRNMPFCDASHLRCDHMKGIDE
jgi:CDGSH-type Zn-finger protein